MVKGKVSFKKRKEVEEIKRLFNEFPIVGLVDFENLPSLQLQRLKQQLKGKIVLRMSKKRLIKIALDQLNKKNLDKFKEKLQGMPALLFTKEDPFELSKLLNKNKSSAFARAGQIAPGDIIVKAGMTNFTPGPVIGELGQIGIKTEVKEGKISIKEDNVVVKAGDVINKNVADLLIKLGIEPVEIGLNLVLIYENGEILSKEVLSVDEKEYIKLIQKVSSEALNLAVYIGYMSNETVNLIISKAVCESEAVMNLIKDKFGKKEEVKKPVEETKEKVKEPVEIEKEEVKESIKEEIEEQKSVEIEEKEIEKTEEIKIEPKEEIKLEEKEILKEEILEEPGIKETELEKEMRAEPEEEKIFSEEKVVIESKEKITNNDMEFAEKFLQQLVDKKIEEQTKSKKEDRIEKEERDINKLINELKDKKIKGEI